ncbi:MAG: hypothetical protein KKC55_14445, partial [Gammaproteobacteria bacterium]|nr:hypothetical protein [Gammaproteobacteria bacterium]
EMILNLKDRGFSAVDICKAITDGFPGVECSTLKVMDAEVGILTVSVMDGRTKVSAVFFI